MSTVRFYLGFQWDSLKSSSLANTIFSPLFNNLTKPSHCLEEDKSEAALVSQWAEPTPGWRYCHLSGMCLLFVTSQQVGKKIVISQC